MNNVMINKMTNTMANIIINLMINIMIHMITIMIHFLIHLMTFIMTNIMINLMIYVAECIPFWPYLSDILTCCRFHICRFSVAAFSNSSRAQPREGKVARCEGNGNFARCEGNGNRRNLRKAGYEPKGEPCKFRWEEKRLRKRCNKVKKRWG